jgi:hypothetical protein
MENSMVKVHDFIAYDDAGKKYECEICHDYTGAMVPSFEGDGGVAPSIQIKYRLKDGSPLGRAGPGNPGQYTLPNGKIIKTTDSKAQ